jgi:hypothetical protein
MKLSKIKRNTGSAEEGVWVTNAVGDIDILIAAMGNKKYTEMLRHLTKPYQRTLKTLGDDFLMDLQNQCISKTVLLGWKNMESEVEDEPNIEYSSKTAYELLKDPENHEFRELVIALADEEEVFRKESVEDATFQAE